MLQCFMVGLGGALGAILRYGIGLLPIRGNFPFSTLFINFIGAILIGCISGIAQKNSTLNPMTILFLKTGFCGGFTTFSTFSLESFTLLENHQYSNAILYILASVLFCLAGIFIGKYAIDKFCM